MFNSFKTYRKKSFLIYVFIFLIPALVLAQEKDIKKDSTYTPYELLSTYYNTHFKPFKKRNVYVGFAMSFEDRQLENTNFLVREILDGDQTKYDLNLKGGYFIGNYAMVGINLNYNQDKFTGLVLNEGDTISSNSLSRGFAITPFIRSSVPLTPNERLSFFTELGLTYGKGTSLTRDISNADEINKIYETNNRFRIGISPGITFFAMENFALEIGLNVLGYEINIRERTVNNIEESRRTTQNVDFEINILSLQLGLAYFFGAGK
ncbi:hypothetical protein [Mangrovimonas futianensis]|uniref:hypothetical protein n=1 Tax=Mangrovimonas futianensis TaxID=2895523 RepID=UPI001E39D3C3|nr:hypothetical protein [Mangrovimonas futianensis]MCF1421298.1 hypothetical protein [Mangrovimonas futianensis]